MKRNKSLLLTLSAVAFINLNIAIPDEAAAADAVKGKAVFAERCASCHGPEGAGDGPIAAALPPDSKPKNLKDGQMKFATDAAKFKELMQKGGAAVGLNPLMTGAPGATDADIENLYAFVKSLHK